MRDLLLLFHKEIWRSACVLLSPVTFAICWITISSFAPENATPMTLPGDSTSFAASTFTR
jgi:hypothetical protein